MPFVDQYNNPVNVNAPHKFKNGLIALPGRCLDQAVANQKVYRAMGKDLKLKLGGIGVKVGRTKVEWLYAPNGHAIMMTDFHSWLEDDDGKVYDMITSPIWQSALCYKMEDGRQFDFPFKLNEVLMGRDKKELAKQNLIYIPTTNMTYMRMPNLFLLYRKKDHQENEWDIQQCKFE